MKSSLLSIILLSSFFALYSSCKKDNNDAAKFVGEWQGTSLCGLTGCNFESGNNGSSLKEELTLGDTCHDVLNVTINGTANGNSISFPKQTFYNNCGESFVVYSSGSLSGNTLSYTIIYVVNSADTTVCDFVGKK